MQPVSLQAILGEAEVVGGLAGLIQAIKKQNRPEASFAEILELVRKMVAVVPTGITMFEAASGQCILCNPAMAAIVGGSADEIRKQNFRELESWRQSGLLEAAERTLATGEDQRLEARLTTPFSQSVWISCVLTSFTSGNIKHLLVLVSDITHRKVAEEAQTHSESKYRTLTEKMGEGLISTDQGGRYTYCNPKFLRMTGYQEDEVLGRTFFELACDYRYETFQARLQNRCKGRSEQYEIQLRHKNGSPIDVLVSAEPLFDSQGEFTGTLGIITDIRERKLQEETSRRTHKIESLTMLAGGIAHDFNNLFQTIQGNLEMAREMLVDPERSRRALERALQTLKKANTLSQRMLDYSGKGSSQSISIDLAELVRMHSTLFSNITSPETEIKYQIPGGLPPIEGDPEQLLLILTSLVTNADEALAGQKGTINITLEEAPASLPREGFWVEPPPPSKALVLSVSDTGCGMAQETMGKLFDPFFTTKEHGRGLGLASALGILKGHQAGLQVQSRPGEGALFRMAFPVRIAGPELLEPLSTAAIVTLRNGYVLLVDDDPGVLSTGAEILKDFLHYKVLTARDGREAVRVFQQHAQDISVILMDATMPNLTGSDAYQAIKAINPEAKAILRQQTGQGTWIPGLSEETLLDQGTAGRAGEGSQGVKSGSKAGARERTLLR
jgi:PAS domain S-box-containing protein